MKILISGFEPFHKAKANPTQEIVRLIDAEKISGVSTVVLPVEFGRSWEVLSKKINEVKPDVVIALGQAEGRSQITPEKIAVNLDDARIPDNAGAQPINQKTIAEGADGLFTTLPVENIVSLLKSKDIPAAISMTAGTFVCNHVFYQMQAHCKEIKTGFIHVPLMESQSQEFPGLPTMPLQTMVDAIMMIIKEFIRL
jgi:pyroglutamyl-peptidase